MGRMLRQAPFAFLKWLGQQWESLLVLAAVATVGIALAGFKIQASSDVSAAGHSDEIAYITMGQNLIAGRGLDVDWVSYYFIPYPRTITHREDHWPPFLGFLHAPVFALYGSSPPTTKISPIIAGTVLLPLAAALLAIVLSQRAYAGLIAGAAILAQPILFGESIRGYSDMAHAAVLTLFFWAIISARKRPWMHLLAGFFAACAFYAKGSELMLLPLYPLIALLTCGFKPMIRRWPWLGLLTALILVAPFLISNWRQFHNPLHSTQNYVSGYIALDDWQKKTYAFYWGQNLPKLSDRWTKYAAIYPALVKKNQREFAAFAGLGPQGSPKEWEKIQEQPIVDHWGEPISSFCGITAISAGCVLLAVGPVLMLLVWLWRILKWRAPPWVCLLSVGILLIPTYLLLVRGGYLMSVPWRVGFILAMVLAEWASIVRLKNKSVWGPLLAIAIVLGCQWAFMVYFWEILLRFSYIFMPAMAAMASLAIVRVIDLPLAGLLPRFKLWWRGSLTIASIALATWFVMSYLPLWRQLPRYDHRHGAALTYDYQITPAWPSGIPPAKSLDKLPFARRFDAFIANRTLACFASMNRVIAYYHADNECVALGAWIKEHLPNAIIMARSPWELKYYAGPGNKTVEAPYSDPKIIFDMARYYHVTHYYHDKERPGLAEYESGAKPGLTRVPGAPGRLYEFHLDQLP